MVRIQYTNKENPKEKIHVFDEDEKKVYFHDPKEIPDYLSRDEFKRKYARTPAK